jgi:hypothetical protein
MALTVDSCVLLRGLGRHWNASALEILEISDPQMLTWPVVASKEKTKDAFHIIYAPGLERENPMDVDAFIP